jgi:glycosyltransferase involved in cell wall biosynthesis
MSQGPAREGAAIVPGAARRPHVVHIVGTLGAGGVQRLVLGMAASPAGRAFRHSVLCLFGTTGSLKERFEEAGLPFGLCGVPWPETLDVGSYRLSRWLRRGLSWTFPVRLARELERREADLVHTHVTYRIDLQAEGAIRRARRPLVWTIHGQYRPEGRELERWRKAARLAAEAGAITAVAEDLARDFRDRGLDHPDGIRVTRGGVDLSAFRPTQGRDPRRRAQWKIPPEAVVFGASGRLVSEKAYEVFTRAAGRVVAEGANAHFVIAGGGPLRPQLEAQIAAAGLNGRFHLVGFLEDVPGFLRELDVFVLSSRFEGFPIALVEALAAGLPCIATPVGGVKEMVGESGALIVPPESEEDLAEAMTKMLSPGLRALYAARGPKLAECFSIDRTADQFAALYDRLLAPSVDAERSRRKVNE